MYVEKVVVMAKLNVLDLLDAVLAFEQKVNLALMYSALRLPQYRVMVFLEKAGKITVTDLSKQLNVTRATMSVLVNDLLKADIVESLKNSTDKRSFYVRLTESGQKRLAVARKDLGFVEDSISENFTEEIITSINEFSCMIRR